MACHSIDVLASCSFVVESIVHMHYMDFSGFLYFEFYPDLSCQTRAMQATVRSGETMYMLKNLTNNKET